MYKTIMPICFAGRKVYNGNMKEQGISEMIFGKENSKKWK